MKYALVPLGCQMNRSDSERIRTVLSGMGYQETEHEVEADLLGIVSCSVRQRAIDKVYSRILLWNSWKPTRSLLTFVSGCILPKDKIRFLKLFDLVFSIEDLSSLPELIRQYGVPTPAFGTLQGEAQRVLLPPDSPYKLQHSTKTPKEKLNTFWEIKPSYSSPYEAFVPIQNGCDKFCTFCAVPYTRGREVSRPSHEILKEVRTLISRGCKSITLLGQNVNSYGLDRPGEELSFPELMRQVGELGRESGMDFWIYFTSPHPRDMGRELLEVIADYPVLAKQLHLPLQSGDDKVLLKMNRNHTLEDYRQVVSNIHEILPQATLFTDIIVGFNGESEEQFENTRLAMEEFRYDMAYIAQYSPRPGAVSARWVDGVPSLEKKRRLRILSDTLLHTAGEKNRRRVGERQRVLVTGEDRKPGYLRGYTEGRIPLRFPSDKKNLIGNFIKLEISSSADLSLQGRLVEA